MTYKYNKFKSITKGFWGQNIILPTAYILLSANQDCLGLGGNYNQNALTGGLHSLSSKTNQISKANELETPQKDDAVVVILGKGILLDLGDGYRCGVIVTSKTKEVFIIKSSVESEWMQLLQRSKQSGVLRLRYDTVEYPHMIKVDYKIFEYLYQSFCPSSNINTGQHSIDKEDFWRKIANDSSWYDLELVYKEPAGNNVIFKEDSIISSTAFTKELYKTFSSANSLISNTLSIKGNLEPTALKYLDKAGFLLTKDKNSLANIVKNILGNDTTWGTKSEIADENGYIICPGMLMGDVLQFDSNNLGLSLQAAYLNLPLEDYNTMYCYLNDGVYYRLIAVNYLKEINKEKYDEKQHHRELIAQLPKKSTIEVRSEQSVNKTITRFENGTNKCPDISNIERNNPITNNPDRASAQDGNHNQTIHNSSVQHTDANLVPALQHLSLPTPNTKIENKNEDESENEYECPDIMYIERNNPITNNPDRASAQDRSHNQTIHNSSVQHTDANLVPASQHLSLPMPNTKIETDAAPLPPLPPPPPMLNLNTKNWDNSLPRLPLQKTKPGNTKTAKDKTSHDVSLYESNADKDNGSKDFHDDLIANIKKYNNKTDYKQISIEERIAAKKKEQITAKKTKDSWTNLFTNIISNRRQAISSSDTEDGQDEEDGVWSDMNNDS